MKKMDVIGIETALDDLAVLLQLRNHVYYKLCNPSDEEDPEEAQRDLEKRMYQIETCVNRMGAIIGRLQSTLTRMHPAV